MKELLLFLTEPIHKFTKALKDSQAEEKGSVTFQCETAQMPSCVAWLKGHTELTAGGRYEMSQKERVLALTIRHLEENDSDIYTCDVGTAKSMAKLTVNGENMRMNGRLTGFCLARLQCLACVFGELINFSQTQLSHKSLSRISEIPCKPNGSTCS